MTAVWLLCSVAVVFWLTAQQPATSLAVFAAMNTQQQTVLFSRTMQLGPGHFAALHGLMVIAMLPVFSAPAWAAANAPCIDGEPVDLGLRRDRRSVCVDGRSELAGWRHRSSQQRLAHRLLPAALHRRDPARTTRNVAGDSPGPTRQSRTRRRAVVRE